MAGTGGNSRHDLDQWNKALLSRDFDLVHTQLLMLDGDVTPAERVQLVQEIFTAVQQIEELTIGKRDSQDDELSPKKEFQVLHPVSDSRAAAGTSRPDTTERDSPSKTRVARMADSPNLLLRKQKKRNKYQMCPVCDLPSIGRKQMAVRDDWYCNSCRLFKLRLDRKYSASKALPICEHRGRKIKSCKGCRRFRLQTFWFAKRQRDTPYTLPLMDTYGENGSSDDEYDCELE